MPRPPAAPCWIAVPVHNEEAALPHFVASLAAQTVVTAGVTLLLNNCTDASDAVARDLADRFPHLDLHIANVVLPPERANVGHARRMAMDLAHERLDGRGLILTTDADTVLAPDFIGVVHQEIAQGADAGGGRVQLLPAHRRALSPGVRRLFLLDIGYRRLTERLVDWIDPEPADPYPRHHQHFGAALAVTAEWYARAGGLPTHPSDEDVAFYHALRCAGGRFRHSLRARAFTSARRDGRAPKGMADALAEWDEQAEEGFTPPVPDAASIERRARARQGVRSAWNAPLPARLEAATRPFACAPDAIRQLVHEAPTAAAAAARSEVLTLAQPDTHAPIDSVVRQLRARIAQLPSRADRPIPLPSRPHAHVA
jgi:hypothetical protein